MVKSIKDGGCGSSDEQSNKLKLLHKYLLACFENDGQIEGEGRDEGTPWRRTLKGTSLKTLNRCGI